MAIRYNFNTNPQRSQLMQRIRGKDTEPEVIFRRALWHNGIRYNKHDKGLIGQPDIAIHKYRIVVFIDGEFWHGYNWEEKKKRIVANKEYWVQKIERNMERDRKIDKLLEEHGWKVLRFWATSVAKDPKIYVNQVLALIHELKQVRHRNGRI